MYYIPVVCFPTLFMCIYSLSSCPNKTSTSPCVCPSQSDAPVTLSCIQSLLLKFSAQELIEVRQPSLASSSSSSPAPSSTLVISVDHTKLWAMIGSVAGAQRTGVKRKAEDQLYHKRAPGSSPSLQSPPSPPHISSISLAPATSSQLTGSSDWKAGGAGGGADKKGRTSKSQSSHLDMEIESLLSQQSTKEQQSKKVGGWGKGRWNRDKMR